MEPSIFLRMENKMFVNVQGCCDPQAKLQEGSTFDGYVPAVGWRGLKLIQEALSGAGTARFNCIS